MFKRVQLTVNNRWTIDQPPDGSPALLNYDFVSSQPGVLVELLAKCNHGYLCTINHQFIVIYRHIYALSTTSWNHLVISS